MSNDYFESNPIEYHEHHRPGVGGEQVPWNHKSLKQITRLRLISDPGFPMWDVSYCWGMLHDGTKVDVQLPFDQLPKRGRSLAIIEAAKQDGVYARGLKIYEAISLFN
jgi:hypothetical protein